MARADNGAANEWIKWIIGILIAIAVAFSGYSFTILQTKVDKDLFNQSQNQCNSEFLSIHKDIDNSASINERRNERLEKKIDSMKDDLNRILIKLGQFEIVVVQLKEERYGPDH